MLGRLDIIQLQSLLAQTAVDLNVDIMLQVIITFILFACTIELGLRIGIENPILISKKYRIEYHIFYQISIDRGFQKVIEFEYVA